MSADQPLTGDELATIKTRAEAAPVGSRCVCSWQMAQARHIAATTEDVSRLVAEIERLQAQVRHLELLAYYGGHIPDHVREAP